MIYSSRLIVILLMALTNAGLVKANTLNDVLKSSTVPVAGPSGEGTAVIVGEKNNIYYILTASHVVGSRQGDQLEVLLPGNNYEAVQVIKSFPGKDIMLARFSSSSIKFNPIPINEFLPYPAPNTPESEGVVNLRGSVNTVTNKAMVAGYSLPTKAVSVRVFRVIDSQIVDKIEGNTDGYDLLYQSSTIPGMSGGAVVGFRDCTNSGEYMHGGFALGISPGNVFPSLIAIHGRSEDYQGQGRSGISLGVPISDDVAIYLRTNAKSLGILSGEAKLRDHINKHFCIGGQSRSAFLNNLNSQPSSSGGLKLGF